MSLLKSYRTTIFIFVVTIFTIALFFVLKNQNNITHKTASESISENKINHVFIIVEENHNWSSIVGNSEAKFVNSLLSNGSYATNYHNQITTNKELHPSELNYISIEAGTTMFPDITFSSDDNPSDTNSTSSTNHLITLLEKKGYSWKSYQEDISGKDCPIDSSGTYAPKHNPFVYFQDVSGNPPNNANAYCRQHIRPFTELKHDLDSDSIPNYVFITPSLDNDMHDGSIGQADSWLSQLVPEITNSRVFKKDGALFITWDEGSENDNTNDPIGMIILSPFAKNGYSNSTEYSHASLLKTIEEIFHITPLLGSAGDSQTKDLFDFFK